LNHHIWRGELGKAAGLEMPKGSSKLHKLVDFELAKIEGNAFFRRTGFAGEALFRSARIREIALFQGAVFKRKATFSGARLRGAFFRGEAQHKLPAARFEDEADFVATHFEVNVEFDGAEFSDEEKLVNFDGSRIDGTWWSAGSESSPADASVAAPSSACPT
jgi:uncharacterized protein YjbI with pentapeptide repeats